MSKRIDLLIATGLTGIVLVGAVVLAMPDPQPSGWGGAGDVQSISISLGAGQATTGEAETDQQAADSVESRAAEEPVAPPEPEAKPEPVAEPETEPESEAEVEQIVEPEPVVEEIAEPEPVVEPEPEISEPVVEPEPEPVVVQKLADVLPVQIKPKPPVAKVKSPEPVKEAKTATPQKTEVTAPTPPAGLTDSSHSEGTVGKATQSQAASSSSGSGGGAASRAAMVDYQSSVLQMLNRYREYPERAKRRGIEGQNSIRVVIARDGTIEVFEMISGSGSRLLDRETQRMIERVKKFPPFPDTMREDRITLSVPVIYNIR